MKLAIVVPCYNEEEVLPTTAQTLQKVLQELIDDHEIDRESKIYFVDDGSTDKTWSLITELTQKKSCFSGIKLSRNQGHQFALLAGLFSAKGDAVISIDADLQDDVRAIKDMVRHFSQGKEIVYFVRQDRTSDSFFKRITAETFYKLMNRMGVQTIYNHADYRLLSRRAIECLKSFNEVNYYLRGIVPLLGFEAAIVYGPRFARLAGETKYPLKKMLGLALEGITSFSISPLRLITLLSFITFTLTLMMSFWVLGIKFFGNGTVPGWASTVLPIYFLGGIQLLCAGIIGEYLAKIYREVKKRPKYIIEKII